MVQLNEIYEGEIISLKKGKNGLVTIKIKTNNKQGGHKNGFFGNFDRKLGGTPGRTGHDCGGVPGHEAERQNTRTESGDED